MSNAPVQAPYSLYEPKGISLEPGSATYVLVPGAGHGSWCYGPVKELLEKAGQTVYTPCLPGVGERADELTGETGLEDHIVSIVSFLEDNDLSDVILVGHSYAGMVITGAADRVPARIRRIVYLDAIHPADGQNVPEAQPLIQYNPVVCNAVERDGVELNMFDLEDTIKFVGVTEPKQVELARANLTPHPWKSFTDHLHLSNPEAFAAIPKSDIYTKITIGGLVATGIATVEEAAASLVIDSGHDLMLIEPELTADMLLYVATLYTPIVFTERRRTALCSPALLRGTIMTECLLPRISRRGERPQLADEFELVRDVELRVDVGHMLVDRRAADAELRGDALRRQAHEQQLRDVRFARREVETALRERDGVAVRRRRLHVEVAEQVVEVPVEHAEDRALLVREPLG